ncbi:MAG: LLM class flavin-dependent oxidoreductase [Acidimicrobiales bacterium]|nr:LLM class flavin-dependent oxidoreductase [Acidimicrobiales bacterium]
MGDSGLRYGSVVFAERFDEYLTWLSAADEVGLDVIGLGDSQNLWGDLYVSLTVAALNTTTARLGPLVTNPITRHPAVAAGAMASLQQLSGGRMFFGIGTGDSAISNLGRRPATVNHFERYCRAVQGLGAGTPVEWDGRPIEMSWPVEPTPLWMAAEGPRTLHLAGQIADGVIIGSGLTDDVVADSQRRIREGAESVGRRFEDIELWWLVKPYLAATEQDGWAALRWTLAGSAMHTFRYRAEDKLVPRELLGPLEQLQQEFAHHTHGKVSRGEHNGALVERLGLTEFLGRRFALAGPAEHISERIEHLMSIGATNLVGMQLVPDRVGFLREFDARVIRPLRTR